MYLFFFSIQRNNNFFNTIKNVIFENVLQINEIFKIIFNIVIIKFIKNYKQLLKNKNL